MLTEDDLLPDPKQTCWNMVKRSILYFGKNKPGPCPKGWRGEVVRVLYCKAGGATDGAHNVILLRQS